MSIVWDVLPETMLSQLADAQSKAIYQAVRALAEKYAPIIQKHMNASIPWHAGGEPDISKATPEDELTISPEPNDMYAWVEEQINEMVIIYLGHDAMINPEPTLEEELAYAPPAMDYFGPQIMADIRAMLGGG